ncbi:MULTISPECIES: hypothetical protein [Ruminococcus]|uniref:hypothetical protein n=1 Tax=Ruminococcus TaxID=1263 RepID=UPI001A9BD148
MEVTRQAFYDHLSHKNAPWKYQALADEMMKIHEKDQYNDCYGRERMYLALQQRKDAAVKKYGIIQSMNSTNGRCHDNARYESMWARMKEELFYSREDESENYFMKELKTMIWRYYMSYWANRRICTANGGLPPAVRRKLYYDHIFLAA